MTSSVAETQECERTEEDRPKMNARGNEIKLADYGPEILACQSPLEYMADRPLAGRTMEVAISYQMSVIGVRKRQAEVIPAIRNLARPRSRPI